jgi:hypothetical protein
MRFRLLRPCPMILWAAALCWLYGAHAAGANAVEVGQPPNTLSRAAALSLDSGHGSSHGSSIRRFGKTALVIRLSDPSRAVWLLPMQQRDGEYCAFVEANEATNEMHVISTFVSCRIRAVKFLDFNGDGFIDAKYQVLVRSNLHNAQVEEELLFLRKPDGSGFCRVNQPVKFAADASLLRC